MDLIVPKKEMFVRKSEALLNARYQLGELALKLISIIYSSVKRSDEVGKYYQLKVVDIAQLLNKNYGEIYNLLDEATDEMLENPLKIVTGESEGKKEWVKFNWISDANYKDGVINFSIAPRLKPYILELQQKFVKYRLENILNLRGVYVIRFYEILKDIFNQETRHNKKAEKIYTLFEFREMLEIPKSYQYSSHIKKLILEKAKKQFAENTDILFTYEEIKTGRKVTHIKFIIYKNPKNYKEELLKAPKEAGKETKPNNWNDWRKELLNKGNLIILFEDETFKLKNKYLFQNDKLLSSEKALEIWQNLYENRDKLKIMNEDEYIQEQIKKVQEEENKYTKLKEIKEKFSGKNILGKINKDTPITEYKIMAIQIGDNDKIELHLEEEYSKERSITLFPNVETLENFLEKARENYLKIS